MTDESFAKTVIGEGVVGALFQGEGRLFRLALWRIWERAKPPLLFIGLNPSTATEERDDPTIRRVARFAITWGFGGLFVGNLFALVTPYPKRLEMEHDHGANDAALLQMRGVCGEVLVGWGTFGALAGTRPADVLALIGKPVYCLGTTKDGWPKHPLYLPKDSKLIRYYRKGDVK